MSGIREKRDIEWLVSWALIDNGLARDFEEPMRHAGFAELGTRVSGGGWAISGPKVSHDDALRIAGVIDGLPADPVDGLRRATEIVLRYGRVGERPDWCEEGVGEWRQMVDKRGRLRWRWLQPGNKRGPREPLMEFVGETQQAVAKYRAEYAVWWISLHDMIEPLNHVLTKFEATGPAAPDCPWLSPCERPRVFDSFGGRHDGLVSGTSARRMAALKARGNLEMPATPGIVHSQGSASRGRS